MIWLLAMGCIEYLLEESQILEDLFSRIKNIHHARAGGMKSI